MAEEERIDLEDIKKLPPEERIKKLEELERKRKEELEKAKEIIESSKSEIDEKEKKKIIVPGFEREDISKIFKRDDEEGLEGSIDEEEIKRQRFASYIHETPTHELYARIQEIYDTVQTTGEVTYNQNQEVYNISQEFERRERSIENGRYKTQSQELDEMLSVGKAVANKLKYNR